MHFRETRKRYRAQVAKNVTRMCPFCDPETYTGATEDFKHFYIVKNIVEYDLWETHRVVEHLLLVPKAHIEDLRLLTDEQRIEYMNIVGEYEARGYNIYARGIKSKRRSVVHQHTHLIKIGGEPARALLLVRKPYFLFKV